MTCFWVGFLYIAEQLSCCYCWKTALDTRLWRKRNFGKKNKENKIIKESKNRKYREFLKLNNNNNNKKKKKKTKNKKKKKKNNWFKNRPRDWIDISPNKVYKWPISTWKDVQHHCLLGKYKLKLQWIVTSYSLWTTWNSR